MRDNPALVALGKALFWDMQLGSDGKVACASCHFHAGADHRVQNQLSDIVTFTPNTRLGTADFPFHQLTDPTRANSQVLRDSSKRTGSQGVYNRKFDALIPGFTADQGTDNAEATFRNGDLNVRQVTGRNAPSVINAVFNFRNFWDGRASEIFNGANPFGLSDTRANVLSNASGSLKLEEARIDRSSLASQAVGPVLNSAEMSYDGRLWPQVGRKMLALRPLAYQRIASDDSVLAAYVNPGGPGFRSGTYLDLVKAAFQQVYWSSTQFVNADGAVAATSGPAGYTQPEFNFSLFFGLAVQAYEATLVSDDTRVDRLADGQATALSATELAGMNLFVGRTGCNACHDGPEMTLASVGGFNGNDALKSGRETGYFNVGLRPPAEDAGLGGADGLGKPLSTTFPQAPGPNSALARFKTPGLRNVEFSGPYFHNGGQATLEQVVQFYNRGGDFPPSAQSGPNIRDLDLSPNEQTQVVAFLKALSDDRVKFERAPFDHPELCVADGQLPRADGNPAFSKSSTDRWMSIPVVGRGGNNAPLQTFEELLAGVGSDGSRAHSLSEPCGIEAVTATGFVNANAASYVPTVLAQSSIATAVGAGFAASAVTNSSATVPTTLGGVTLNVTDAEGTTRAAPLFFVSPTQINYAIPEGTAPGAATLRLTNGATSFRSQALIQPVAPGIFAVNGMAAANILTVRGSQQTLRDNVIANPGGTLSLAPIDLAAADQTYLVLYGTGIRNHRQPVTALFGLRLGTLEAPVDFAGAQGTYAGEDQINLLLPQSLKGAGTIELRLTVDGVVTNPVRIQIQ